ncbi:ppGpp synthetase catalytic domain-containing protein (RelA/SpoT-type nucleotidyltranferase) [Butyrivibrio fibrisolvens DSM 3071]|jgi:ppGpp synthetase/RelA/SpoT-type nucleotidyltranferase|uniref:PpGpp synthetase catalytic domain-containing protein (RelA/SpoT-type nucleotidyltranferase) n=1 Tax=Butyrivibrio fibrisolvens DSM 3071 TaxID=1121131 RepID=A0A1M5ZST4_BUTFI|nr:GTP pyrophosphokinase family protein [Butyrivibrio fibrisolvens]SHI26983.1 ppGpp synthetase catalytic domain-containing protein (RelA/SpoT-type nucleotidyltranferase) [Butyrivibrio fibrisolvens DSM 3071]
MERDKIPAERMLGNISLSDLKTISQEDIEQLLRMTDQIQDFQELMMKYECAMYEIKTKLDVLNKELSLRNNRNPFESIKTRIKAPISLFEKMQRKGIPFKVENIKNNISDVAGIRVICSFIDDIYMLADCLKDQDDVRLIEIKDYIENPKPSGYRSLHLILEVPIFLTHDKEFMTVEVQFRTIAMDFWASLEHKMKYKKDIQDAEMITEDLCFSADMINQIDRRMQQIRERIDSGKVKDSLSETKIDFSNLEYSDDLISDADKNEQGEENEPISDSKPENTINAVLDAAKKQISHSNSIEVEPSDPIFIASANAKDNSKKKSAKAIESSIR